MKVYVLQEFSSAGLEMVCGVYRTEDLAKKAVESFVDRHPSLLHKDDFEIKEFEVL